MRIVRLKGMRQVNGLHYAPDGRRLLAVGQNGSQRADVAVWIDIAAGTKRPLVHLRASCYAVTSDLKKIAVGNPFLPLEGMSSGTVEVFDPSDGHWWADGPRRQTVIKGASRPFGVWGLTFTPNGSRLAISYSHPDVESIAREHGRLAFATLGSGDVESFAWDGETPSAMAFSPDESVIALAWGCWQTSPPRQVGVFSTKPFAQLSAASVSVRQPGQIAYSPDGNVVAVTCYKDVVILSATSLETRHSMPHSDAVNAVAFTPDGRRILTTCTDKLVRVWDAATGQLVASYDWNVGVTNAIAVAPDGLTAAVSGQSGKVVLFDLGG